MRPRLRGVCARIAAAALARAPPHGDAAHSPGPAPAPRASNKIPPPPRAAFPASLPAQTPRAARRGSARRRLGCVDPPQLTGGLRDGGRTRRRLDWNAAGMKREDRPGCGGTCSS
ncbi:hypothetical protein AOLI_G00107000 [Acnodon oligacanthus]